MAVLRSSLDSASEATIAFEAKLRVKGGAAEPFHLSHYVESARRQRAVHPINGIDPLIGDIAPGAEAVHHIGKITVIAIERGSHRMLWRTRAAQTSIGHLADCHHQIRHQMRI